jgi:hypothetical protein
MSQPPRRKGLVLFLLGMTAVFHIVVISAEAWRHLDRRGSAWAVYAVSILIGLLVAGATLFSATHRTPGDHSRGVFAFSWGLAVGLFLLLLLQTSILAFDVQPILGGIGVGFCLPMALFVLAKPLPARPPSSSTEPDQRQLFLWGFGIAATGIFSGVEGITAEAFQIPGRRSLAWLIAALAGIVGLGLSAAILLKGSLLRQRGNLRLPDRLRRRRTAQALSVVGPLAYLVVVLAERAIPPDIWPALGFFGMGFGLPLGIALVVRVSRDHAGIPVGNAPEPRGGGSVSPPG